MATDRRQAASADQQAVPAEQQAVRADRPGVPTERPGAPAERPAGSSHQPRHAKQSQLLEDQIPAQGGRPQPGDRAQAEPVSRRLASHPVVGFIPWILFWVIGGSATWETGTIAALIAAILVIALSMDLPPLVAQRRAHQEHRRPGRGQASSLSRMSTKGYRTG